MAPDNIYVREYPDGLNQFWDRKKRDDIFQKEVHCSYRACAENRDIHIHTLQHALRLCRIKKEIEL